MVTTAQLLRAPVERRPGRRPATYAGVMNQRLILLLVCCAGLLMVLLQRSPANPGHPGVQLVDARMQTAALAFDPARVIQADFDDSGWPRLDQSLLARMNGPYWLRLHYELESGHEPPQALTLGLRAASESWWDGRWLGHNGRPALNARNEIPGRIDWPAALPPEHTDPGRHVLVIRASSLHRGFNPYSAAFGVYLGRLDQLLGAPIRAWLVVAVAFGGMLVVLAFFAQLTRQTVLRPSATKSSEWLLLSLGAVVLLLLLVEAWRPLLGYDYPMHRWRMWLVLLLSALASLLLPWYLSRRCGLRISRPWSILAISLVLGAIALPSFDLAGAVLHLLAMLAALGLLWKAPQPLPERNVLGLLLVLGLFSLALAPMRFADGAYFVFIGALLVLLLLLHANQLSLARQSLEQVETQRARLQAELLRLSIQPHWLMNTLTALQELIEQQPTRASAMVEALGREFDLLRRASSQPLIRLDEELALCRVHLEIMAMARLQPFELHVQGDTRDLMLPPGILHTLVENSLTHAGLASEGHFLLEIERAPHLLRLCLLAPLGRGRETGSGTGTRFIEARLQTEYPGRHRFMQRIEDGQWQSLIEIETS